MDARVVGTAPGMMGCGGRLGGAGRAPRPHKGGGAGQKAGERRGKGGKGGKRRGGRLGAHSPRRQRGRTAAARGRRGLEHRPIPPNPFHPSPQYAETLEALAESGVAPLVGTRVRPLGGGKNADGGEGTQVICDVFPTG